jgi:periplasmic protein TonB
MRGNLLFNIILAGSILFHVALITRIALPAGFFNDGKIRIDYFVRESERPAIDREAVKPPPEQPKLPDPVKKPEPPPPVVRPAQVKTAQVQSGRDASADREKIAAALPAPPPNPIRENSIVASSGILETASVDPNAPRGLKHYDTETAVPPTSYSPDGVAHGAGDGTSGSAVSAPAPVKKDEKKIDIGAIVGEYGTKVRALIERRKKYPPRAKRLGIQGEVRLEFTVAANGGLLDSRVSASSGAEAIDEAALQAVRAAAPFPPLPPELSVDRLKLAIKLIYKYE